MAISYRLEDESYKYTYGSHVKISTEEPKTLPRQICCKNDWVVTQLVLRSDQEMKVNIGHDPSLYPKGAISEIRVAVDIPHIPSSAIQTHLVGLIKDDDGQYKSDLLMDEKAIYVEAEKEQAVR